MSKIGVIGCGYVGLVTGTSLAELGNKVICADIDADKLKSLSLGISPLYEPGLQAMLESNISRGSIEFTADIDEAIGQSEIVFIAVGTPTTTLGTSDLSQVNSAIDRVLAGSAQSNISAEVNGVIHASSADSENDSMASAEVVNIRNKVSHTGSTKAPGAKIVVMKSTVPVGTGERFSRMFRNRDNGNLGASLRYVSNPEFLREGQAVGDFMNPDRVVVGGSDMKAVRIIAGLYDSFNAPLILTNTTNAELIKYASNAFLATKISFVNEIANLCEEVNADVGVVTEGMGLDPRINPHFLRAGIGYGGSCFPKDVKALKQLAGHNGYHFELLSAVIEVNEMQKTRPIQKLRRYLRSLNGKRIAVLGLTFKPNTDDVRESVGVDVVRLLQFEGAQVSAFDPIGIEQARKVLSGVVLTDNPYIAAENAQAIIITTDDPHYASLDWELIKEKMAYPLIIDGRNIIDSHDLPEGFILDRVGKPVELQSAERVSEPAAVRPGPVLVQRDSKRAS